MCLNHKDDDNKKVVAAAGHLMTHSLLQDSFTYNHTKCAPEVTITGPFTTTIF
jgi:hypothetical protein